MESDINVNKIRAVAQNWSLEGDNYLLEWMKQISENMERRSNATTSSLQQLTTDLTRTHIALDNAANSLNALQYSQFVESRCHNDDETLANPADVPSQAFSESKPTTKTSKEIIQTFLRNNLNMLENCHEKYVIDFEEDSDEEEPINKYIYQPKNPYNERLLPHIYGSKLWHDTPHIGLCDNVNNYSGDEQSDKFSESSNTPEEENDELFESSTNLSAWASSTSITNDKPPTVQHSATPQSRKPSLLDQAPMVGVLNKIAAAATPDRRTDLFSALDDTPPGTSTSSTGTVSGSSSLSSPSLQQSVASNNNNQPKTTAPRGVAVLPTMPPSPHINVGRDHLQRPLFIDEDPPPMTPLPTPPVATKRRPINIFDDDDYDSFLSEITEKAQAKQTDAKKDSDVERRATSQPNTGSLAAPKESQPIQISPSKPKPARVNLFESPDASPTDEDGGLFSSKYTTAAASKTTPVAATTATAAPSTVGASATRQSLPTRITGKSLFDDDDDDDDFLNVFQTRNRAAPSLTTSRLFFDDEKENEGTVTKEPEVSKVKEVATKSSNLFKESNTPDVSVTKSAAKKFTSSLFDDDENDEDDLFGFSTSKKVPTPKEGKQSEDVSSNSQAIRQEEAKSQKEDLQTTKEQQLKKEQQVEQQQKAEQERQEEQRQLRTEQERQIKEEQQRQEEQKQQKVEQERQVVEEQQKNEQLEKQKEQQQPKVEVQKEEPPPIEEPEPKMVSPAKMKPPNKLSSILFDDEDTEDSLFAVKPPSPTKTPRGNDFAETPRPSPAKTNREQPVQQKQDQSTSDRAEPTPRLSVSPQKQKTFEVPHVPPSQNYTNIFMDEPPDDDDFFQTLGASTLSASKMTLDIEHDFDEPPLPQPTPKTAESGNNNASEPKQATYTGFQLFSDIPPDDDGSDYRKVPAPVAAKHVVHSVFYDDFDETLAAMRTKNKPAEKQPKASLFGDEPPPDVPSAAGEEKLTTPEPQVELTKDETDRIVRADSLDSTAKEPVTQANAQRPRSKLKMPNININVQALMPNAGGKPQYQRSASEPTDEKKVEAAVTPNTSSPSFEESPRIVEKRDESNPNVLSSVNKSRVRAPAKRRPSSRQARQESYRKSIIAEEEESKQFETVQDVTIKAKKPATESVVTGDRTTTKEAPSRREETKKEDPPRREETKKESYPILEAVKKEDNPKREEAKKETPPRREEAQKEDPNRREETRKEPGPILEVPPKREETKNIEAIQPKIESKIPMTAETSRVPKKNILQAFLEEANDEDDDDFLFNISQKSSKSGGASTTSQAAAAKSLSQEPATRAETTTIKEKETTPVRSERNLEEPPLFEDPPEDLADTRKTDSPKKPQLFESRSLFDEPPEDSGFDSMRPAAKSKTEEKTSQPYKVALGNADFLFDDPPPEDTFFSSLRREEPKAAGVSVANIPTTKENTKPQETTEARKQPEPAKEVAVTGKPNEPLKENTEEAESSPHARIEKLKTVESLKESVQPEKASESATAKVGKPSEQVKPVKPASNSLFGDSDDDDGDDLFDSMETVRKSASRTVAPPLSTVAAAGPVKATAAKPLPTKPTKSLFPSDDSDDDGARDLFRGATAKPPAVTANRRTAAAPLFGDDDSNGSDNDQLFAAPKKLESKAVRRNTPAAPLFSDDDDDDDLFGAKNTPAAKVMKSKTTPASVVTSPLVATKVQPAATPLSASRNVSDNPLADLLDS